MFQFIVMYFHATSLALAAFFTTVHSHAAILAAVGDKGESRGFLGMYRKLSPYGTDTDRV